MNLAIIEFSKTHYISVITFCNVLSKDNHISCFVTKDIYANISLSDKQNIEFIVKQKEETFFQFSKKIINHLKSSHYDFVLFNSIDKLFLENLYMFSKIRTKKVLTIHNVNVYFAKRLVLKPALAVKMYIRKHILKRVDAINVYSNDIIEYINKTYRNDKPIFLIPFINYEPHWRDEYKNLIDTKVIKIAIPGMVELRRRDYHAVKELLETIEMKGVSDKIKIVILGSANDEEGRAMIKELEKFPNVKAFHSFISDEEFTTEMASSHFVIGNLNRYIKIGDVIEEYSVTKQSGINANMVKYGLPCLCLSDMQCSKELEGMYIHFDTMEKNVDYLCELLNDYNKYTDLREKAFNISQQFSIDNLLEKFNKTYALLR